MSDPFYAFVKCAADVFRLQGPVYQFGSDPRYEQYDQPVLRACFPNAAYMGFDLDETTELERLPFRDGAARTVICLDSLERALEPQRAPDELQRILAPGGALLICAPLGETSAAFASRPWRPTPRSVGQLMASMGLSLLGRQGTEPFAHTLYGIGFKSPATAEVAQATDRFLHDFQTALHAMAGEVGWAARLWQWLSRWSRHNFRRGYYDVQFTVQMSIARTLYRERSNDTAADPNTGTRLDLLE